MGVFCVGQSSAKLPGTWTNGSDTVQLNRQAVDHPLYTASYSILCILAIALPLARILHRIGHSRWPALLVLIPFIGTLGLQVFAFSKWPAATSALALVILTALICIIGLWIFAFIEWPTVASSTSRPKELDDHPAANTEAENSLRVQPDDSYPPYNLVRAGNNFRISFAIPGVEPARVAVVVHQKTLIVSGSEAQKSDDEYLHQGIASSAFERRFSLAEFIEVKEALLEDGLLQIDLAYEVPEAMKPRRMEISYPRHYGIDWNRPSKVPRVRPRSVS